MNNIMVPNKIYIHYKNHALKRAKERGFNKKIYLEIFS